MLISKSLSVLAIKLKLLSYEQTVLVHLKLRSEAKIFMKVIVN